MTTTPRPRVESTIRGEPSSIVRMGDSVVDGPSITTERLTSTGATRSVNSEAISCVIGLAGCCGWSRRGGSCSITSRRIVTPGPSRAAHGSCHSTNVSSVGGTTTSSAPDSHAAVHSAQPVASSSSGRQMMMAVDPLSAPVRTSDGSMRRCARPMPAMGSSARSIHCALEPSSTSSRSRSSTSTGSADSVEIVAQRRSSAGCRSAGIDDNQPCSVTEGSTTSVTVATARCDPSTKTASALVDRSVITSVTVTGMLRRAWSWLGRVTVTSTVTDPVDCGPRVRCTIETIAAVP